MKQLWPEFPFLKFRFRLARAPTLRKREFVECGGLFLWRHLTSSALPWRQVLPASDGWLVIGFILTVAHPMLSNQNEVDRNAPESQWLVYSTDNSLIQKGTGRAKEFSSAEEYHAETKRRADY